jgi:molecular chaperone Hsp33
MQDLIQPFQLETSHLRGRFVRLGSVIDQIIHQHAYPAPVAALLAETAAIALALATSLKFSGVFTLQTKGDGPVRMMVADVTHDGAVRGYAQFDRAAILRDDMKADDLLGKGYLAFTVDQGQGGDRYQGLVELQAGGMAAAVQHYFKQSEQIPTGIKAAAEYHEGHWTAGCLLVQRMPSEGGIQHEGHASPPDDAWFDNMIMLETVTPEELCRPGASLHDILFRLFHEDGVRVYETLSLRHECRCSRKRIEDVLASLPRAEILELLEDGKITVNCEFCNTHYDFLEDDIPVSPQS